MLTVRDAVLRVLEGDKFMTVSELLDTPLIKTLSTNKDYMYKLLPRMERAKQIAKVPNLKPYQYKLAPKQEETVLTQLVSPTLYESGKLDLSFQLSDRGKVILDKLEGLKASETENPDTEMFQSILGVIDKTSIEFTIEFLVDTIQALQVKQLE